MFAHPGERKNLNAARHACVGFNTRGPTEFCLIKFENIKREFSELHLCSHASC